MTHLSSFRYYEKMNEPPSVRRAFGEVRVSNFDPRTGEPCEEKPEPLGTKRAEKPSSLEVNAKRTEAIEEAAEIMRNMRARRAREYKEKSELPRQGGKKRAVLVDGVRYQSVAAAARELGTPSQYLGKQLLSGKGFLKGRRIEFAKEEG